MQSIDSHDHVVEDSNESFPVSSGARVLLIPESEKRVSGLRLKLTEYVQRRPLPNSREEYSILLLRQLLDARQCSYDDVRRQLRQERGDLFDESSFGIACTVVRGYVVHGRHGSQALSSGDDWRDNVGGNNVAPFRKTKTKPKPFLTREMKYLIDTVRGLFRLAIKPKK